MAFSDLVFSLTIPFTALDGLSNHWPLGDSMLACKYVTVYKPLKVKKSRTRCVGAMETPHHGNASKTAFEEFPFYFGKSLKTGKG